MKTPVFSWGSLFFLKLGHKVLIQLNLTNGNHSFNLSLYFAPVRFFAFSSLRFPTVFSITSLFCRNNRAVHKCSSNSSQCSSPNTSPGQNFQNTKCGWNPCGVIITPEMELADNTYLDGDGESVLKALEEANPQTIEPQERYGRHHSCVCRSFEGGGERAFWGSL